MSNRVGTVGVPIGRQATEFIERTDRFREPVWKWITIFNDEVAIQERIYRPSGYGGPIRKRLHMCSCRAGVAGAPIIIRDSLAELRLIQDTRHLCGPKLHASLVW